MERTVRSVRRIRGPHQVRREAQWEMAVGNRSSNLSRSRWTSTWRSTPNWQGLLERPVQHLYFLELACNNVPEKKQHMYPEARESITKRAAAEVATNIKSILAEEKTDE